MMTPLIAFMLALALMVWVGIFGFAVINAGRTGGILDFRRKGGWDNEHESA